MAIPDVQRPAGDPYFLVGNSWPSESENSYRTAAADADTACTTTRAQAESADDAARRTDSGMQGRTADSVSGGYSHKAEQLHQQSQDYSTISGWMTDAGGKVSGAKGRITDLVSAGNSEIRDAINSETAGTPVTPSSTELTSRYRNDIASVASKLTTDLDAIGHSLVGTPGASTTPSYVSAPTTPSTEHADPHATVVSYNHGQSPEVTPKVLPDMPRAVTAQNSESASTPTAPAVATPHGVNPTLSNLISGSGSPSASSPGGMGSPHTSSQGSPSAQNPQVHQTAERHQDAKAPVLPRIPSVPLPNIPAAAESITTAVTSAAGHQLPTPSTAPSTPAPLAPASTGTTPGTPGIPPITPASPAGLSPIGGVPTPPVVQAATPAVQGAPPPPVPGVQAPSAPQTPSAPQQTAALRGPVVDAAWLQRTYGLSPSLELPKPETPVTPALFIAGLPAPEAHLHRALATLRHQFEAVGWSQPLAVANIRRGFEHRTVYVTADGLSIHPSGVSLPAGVTPLDEMADVPITSRLEGSLMVTDKLTSLIPRGWEIEGVLSTVPGGENSQTVEQYQELVEGGELLECKVSRGRSDVGADEAMRVFARASIGSRGCGELEVESARLRAARWVGVQPTGYVDGLSRWYLADAAESMSQGNWGEAVCASEKYMSVNQPKSQAA